ncbi:MAG: hypothetical protein JW862_00335 [Anaerolineales bacterium]|nr:hypothetical protein [Anaerolineales bacterium]
MKTNHIPLSVLADHPAVGARADDQEVEGLDYSYTDYGTFRRPFTQLLLPENKPVAAVKRFIILVPAESFSVSDFLFQVNQYTPPGMTLLFVTSVTDPDQEMVARRQMILMENIIRSPSLQVHSRIVYNQSWSKAIKEIWREGDLIICLEDHQDWQFLFTMTSLGRKIFSAFHVPVLIHQGIHLWERPPYLKTLREIAAWFSFIATISLFSFLQITVNQSLADWPGRLFLCLTLIVEFFLIWKINEFFN